MASVHLANPMVRLGDSANAVRLGITATLSVIALGSATAKVEAEGALRYEAGEGALYLAHPRVSHLDVSGVPEQFKGNVKDVASRALVEYLSRMPLYKLKETSPGEAFARRTLQSVSVRHQTLILRFSAGSQ